MAAVKWLLVLAALIGAEAGKHDIYSRYSVHNVEVRDREDQVTLHDLEHALNLDVWQHAYPGAREAIVMVSPENEGDFLKALDDYGMKHSLHLSDVATAFEEFDREMTRFRSLRNTRVPFADYPRYVEVDEYLERIAAEYPDIVTLVNAGNSYDGLPIKYLKISTTNFTDTSKPIYFMDATIHAREWVTTPVALYSIHRLVEDLRDQDRDLLENVDWIIHPLVNPDGYEHTHTTERLWRRTRSFNPSGGSEFCYGVDANRNFDVQFNTTGVSQDPCSQTYPGVMAFSEPETQIVRDILFEYLDRIQLYMNIHSHGNYVLFGYGDHSLPSNAMALHLIGAVMGAEMDAVKLPGAGFYLVGNSAMVLYGTSGSAQDYAQVIGVPFSYTLELPGYGRQFQVPPEYIPHFTEETWRGIAATARLARLHYSGPY